MECVKTKRLPYIWVVIIFSLKRYHVQQACIDSFLTQSGRPMSQVNNDFFMVVIVYPNYLKSYGSTSLYRQLLNSGVECEAHNLEVLGSKPREAKYLN
ncbi:hypothetical protein DDB_G0292708 [Dictyostelium discoideum AX4]|uniref:Uncharacterized protein n=1 Tax=Dictyostelium discoideum TaxID=44689 RepID=Q54CV0_DICDI|nr:hypothetical protein DDB_G0292708 [Dictyostelium discoideum AX4]EAL61157.1 hypothetical protein DDB_G0292708 [Dictyostelium discoideum AX4]|eukprot:XP_629570.1 hypothetical protein DDB_G0292708 [Dictyostelium discoideum AX4]